MQLDRTEIAIRERRPSELLDLALRVTSVYAGPLLLWTGIVAFPFAMWNAWCIGWMVREEYSAGNIFRYSVTMAQLIILEAPWATLATTLFLGRDDVSTADVGPVHLSRICAVFSLASSGRSCFAAV